MDKEFHKSRRRLLRLAYHLMAHVKPEVNISDWAVYPDHTCEDEHNATNVLANIVSGSNGAVACATIHACTIPMFNRAGLMMRVTLEKGNFGVAIDPVFTPPGQTEIYFQGKDAICEFFTLTEEEFDYLFKPVSYEISGSATKSNIARRIHSLTYQK